jgi:hypothetical protein
LIPKTKTWRRMTKLKDKVISIDKVPDPHQNQNIRIIRDFFSLLEISEEKNTEMIKAVNMAECYGSHL